MVHKPEEEDIQSLQEAVREVVRQRGYVIVASANELKIGTILTDCHYAFSTDSPITQPVRIVDKTDFADFDQQRIVLGGPPAPWMRNWFFYRVESD